LRPPSCFAPALAEDAAAPNPVETAEAKSTLTIANAMINYGRANQDALAMISGVQMMITASEGTTIEAGGKPMDLGAILDEAVAMAPDDELIVARADALRDEAETKSPAAPATGNTGAITTATANTGTSATEPAAIFRAARCPGPPFSFPQVEWRLPQRNKFPVLAQKRPVGWQVSAGIAGWREDIPPMPETAEARGTASVYGAGIGPESLPTKECPRCLLFCHRVPRRSGLIRRLPCSLWSMSVCCS
jgi:hypothetical protein